MPIKTIRTRLTLAYSGTVLIIFLAFGVALFAGLRKELIDTVDDRLIRSAKDLAGEGLKPKTLRKNAEIIKRLDTAYYRIVNRNGEVIISSLNVRDQWPLNKELMLSAFKGSPRYEDVKYQGENYRTLYYPVNEENLVYIRESLKSGESDISRLQRLFLLFLPAVILASLLVSWLLAGRLLAPLVAMKSLVERIRHGRLKERISLRFKGKEIEDLVLVFNEMLDGIQHSVESQKRFSSDVSHEIRSPLTSLRGTIDVALRKKRTPEEYEEVLRSSLADIVRLSKITDNLLFLAKADNNILELRRQWLDICHLIETVVEQLRDKALSAGISVVAELGSNVEISGDADLLEQAFTNLIDNAIKYSPNGGTITVRAEEEKAHVTVTVSDSGVGIRESDIPHVFDRFYRGNRGGSRRLGGTGLGLAITKWIVNAHGGTVGVKSVEGSGSDFFVVLPKNLY